MMKIQVSDNKIVISWIEKIRECNFPDLVEIFKKADEKERRRLAVIHFGEKYFEDITPQIKRKPQVVSERQSSELDYYWDDSAQEELDNILGSDPYTMFY